MNKCGLGILVSGSGTNLQAIIDRTEETNYPAEVRLVISNVSGAYALKRAEKKDIPTAVVPHGQYSRREDFEKELVALLQKADVDLVVLAGFMRVLSPYFLKNFQGRILNIHPSLLPAFPGVHSIEKAWDYGVKVTGVTVHFVDEGTDTGPIILQKEVAIREEDTLESLTERMHQVEHQLFPEAIRLFAEDRLEIQGCKVHLKKEEL